MKITLAEFRILLLVYKSSHNLSAFTVFRRLKHPYEDFVNAINKLIEKGFIEEVNKIINITSKGEEFLLNKKNNYLIVGEKSWRKIPPEFRQVSIESNEFYVPNKSILDSRQFKIN